MARGQGEHPSPTFRHLPDNKKIVARMKRLPVQLKAFEIAKEPFFGAEGAFDRVLWKNGFESSDPHMISLVWSVSNGYQTLINHYIGMLQAGVRAVDLPAARQTRLNAPQTIEAIRDDGGLSPE